MSAQHECATHETVGTCPGVGDFHHPRTTGSREAASADRSAPTTTTGGGERSEEETSGGQDGGVRRRRGQQHPPILSLYRPLQLVQDESVLPIVMWFISYTYAATVREKVDLLSFSKMDSDWNMTAHTPHRLHFMTLLNTTTKLPSYHVYNTHGSNSKQITTCAKSSYCSGVGSYSLYPVALNAS